MSGSTTGYSSDVDWNTIGKNGAGNSGANNTESNSNSTVNQLDFFGFLSHLQILSVQESLATNKPSENIVTIGKFMNGIRLGFSAGVWMSLLMFFYAICFIYFTASVPRLDGFIDKIIVNFWIIPIAGASMWMGYFSRYVTGAMTHKLVSSLFIGKMIASLLAGGLVVYLMSEFKELLKTQRDLFIGDGYLSILKLDIDFILKSYPQLYSMLVIQIIVASFLAFVMLQFRHFFISGDMKEQYKEY